MKSKKLKREEALERAENYLNKMYHLMVQASPEEINSGVCGIPYSQLVDDNKRRLLHIEHLLTKFSDLKLKKPEFINEVKKWIKSFK